MLYLYDITAIAQRNVPRWFRHARNLSWVRVITRGLRAIHDEFLVWRQNTIIAQYRFNGLVHSLEWVLNDRFDAVERRIHITVVEQVPVLHHLDLGEPALAHYLAGGQLSGYFHLSTDTTPSNYLYEFLVNVPASISFSAPEMFELLDLYRYAGRRPAIRRYTAPNIEVEIILHPSLGLPANQPPESIPLPDYDDE